MKKITFYALTIILLNITLSTIISIHAHFVESNTKSLSSQNSISISTKEISYNNNYIGVDLNIPLLNGLKDKNIQDKINTDILNYICELKNKAEISAKADIKNNISVMPYIVQTNYDVHYTSFSFLSLTIMYYEYTGGAHGISYKTPYNLNLNTGKNITLEKLFKPSTNYINLINKEIQFQIGKKNSVLGSIPITEFKSISNDQPFYIDGNNLVIYFQPYELGAYALGIQEFKISLSKLHDLQKFLIEN